MALYYNAYAERIVVRVPGSIQIGRQCMLKFTAILLASALTAAPALARDTAHAKPPKVAHNQAKAQKKAMDQAAKAQRKDLKKTRKRANP